jgi:hypothetical protein
MAEIAGMNDSCERGCVMRIGKIAAICILLCITFVYPGLGHAASTAPTVGVSPTTAAYGSTVTVQIGHFGGNEKVSITWDSPTGPLLTTLTTGSLGSSQGQFTMPSGLYGTHTVYATGQSSGLNASTTMQETAGITLNQGFGQPGFGIVATGGGFYASETVTVTFGPSGGPYQFVATATTDSNGGFTSSSFAAPNSPSGPFTVIATGQTSRFVATALFHLQNYSQPISANVTATFGQPYSSSYTTQINNQLLGTNLNLALLGPYLTKSPPQQVTSMLDQMYPNSMQPGVVRMFVAQQNIVLANMNQNTPYQDYYWTKFDQAVQYIEANHMTPEIVLWQVANYNAPPGVPNNNTSYPVNPSEWGRVAANFIRHANIDMGFGIHYWEIWNEPELQLWYQNSMTEPQYVTLFDDAVTQMKAVDPTIAVGGPELSQLPLTNQSWLIPFLQDPTVEQNVDFITWHVSQFDITQLAQEIAMVRQEIQTYDPSRASAISYGPDEYEPWVDVRNWTYDGATGSATFLTTILQAGATLASTWVAWDIMGFYQYPPYQGSIFLYENMINTQLNPTPRAIFYQVLANQLAIYNQTVDSSSSSYSPLSVLTTSSGASGPSALVLGNDSFYPTQANVSLHFQTVGQHTLSVYTIGDDSVGDGSGQGLNGTLTETITVTTDNSGNAQISLPISPWTVQAIAVTGG